VFQCLDLRVEEGLQRQPTAKSSWPGNRIYRASERTRPSHRQGTFFAPERAAQ
jgi:hypothetical protein